MKYNNILCNIFDDHHRYPTHFVSIRPFDSNPFIKFHFICSPKIDSAHVLMVFFDFLFDGRENNGKVEISMACDDEQTQMWNATAKTGKC